MMRASAMALMASSVLFSQGLLAHGPDEFEDVPAGLVQASLTDRPAVEGLQLMLLEGQQQGLMVSYQGEEPLILHGKAGEPFLRFSTTGVEVNQDSRTWQQVQGQDGSGADDQSTNWVNVASSQRYAWMDPRLSTQAPSNETDKRQTLSNWQIALTHEGQRSHVGGELYWRPLTQKDHDHSQNHDHSESHQEEGHDHHH